MLLKWSQIPFEVSTRVDESMMRLVPIYIYIHTLGPRQQLLYLVKHFKAYLFATRMTGIGPLPSSIVFYAKGNTLQLQPSNNLGVKTEKKSEPERSMWNH